MFFQLQGDVLPQKYNLIAYPRMFLTNDTRNDHRKTIFILHVIAPEDIAKHPLRRNQYHKFP